MQRVSLAVMALFAHEAANADSLSSSEIKFSGEDRSGSFWIANLAGRDQFDRHSGRVTLHVPLPESRTLKVLLKGLVRHFFKACSHSPDEHSSART